MSARVYPVGCSTVRIQHKQGKPINTRFPVVELVKLMAWRQTKSLMKIPGLLVVRKFVKPTFAHQIRW